MFGLSTKQGEGCYDPEYSTTTKHTFLALGGSIDGFYHKSTQVRRKQCYYGGC